MDAYKERIVDMYHALCAAYAAAARFGSNLEPETIEEMAVRLVADGYGKPDECENAKE